LKQKRVVITGIGIVSPAGNGFENFSRGLKEGICGAGPITCFDASAFSSPPQVYEVKNFNAHAQGTHILDPFIQYAVAAAAQAIESAQFKPAEADPYRTGIAVSSSKGGMHTLDRFKERFFKNPSAILGARIYSNTVPNFAAQWIARRWKFQGPAKCYVAACATGTVALIEGARMVADGIADYCLAGASDASIVPLMIAAYQNMKVLAKDGLRPFDHNRSGFLVGEGAGVLFLETLESAQARKAKIYGEFLGGAYAMDGYDPLHFDSRNDALKLAVEKLLKSVDAGSIDYIHLHGTGTKVGDIYETEQLKKAFGKKAAHIPMSSTKAATGHMLGASGAVGTIAALAGMEYGFVPPTLLLEKPDPQCDLDYTANQSKNKNINYCR
jgi:3-oxoacyl-[acyl-carrier-protein] synthase II